jgi:hypothetical protein
MAHPPYPTWHHLSDATWPVFLVVGVCAGLLSVEWRSIILSVLMLIAVISWKVDLGLRSWGPFVSIPLGTIVAVLSVLSLGRSFSHQGW